MGNLFCFVETGSHLSQADLELVDLELPMFPASTSQTLTLQATEPRVFLTVFVVVVVVCLLVGWFVFFSFYF